MGPAAVAARLLSAQSSDPLQEGFPAHPGRGGQPESTRLPNGKIQRDEILKAEYEKSLKDARELVDMSKSFELDLEKSDAFVLSLPLLKKLDEIEKISRRIRARMKR